MTDEQIGMLARKYVDDSLANGGASPSPEIYDVAIERVEAHTRKLLAAAQRGAGVDREAIVR